MKRVVISLPTEVKPFSISPEMSPTTGLKLGEGLDKVSLNFFSLYWDEVIVPNGGIVGIGIDGEDSFIDAGVLKRPTVPGTSDFSDLSNIDSKFITSQTYFLDEYRKTHPETDWRLNSMGNDLVMLDAESERKKSIRLEIANALPVPDQSVNIADILEFKDRRRPELDAFNTYFDDLYLEVVNSGDLDLSKKKAFEKVSKSIQDLEVLNQETWRSPIRFNTSAVLENSISDIISGASTLEAIWQANHGNLSATVVSTSMALASLAVGRVKIEFQSVRRKPKAHMAYISHANKEGLVKL